MIDTADPLSWLGLAWSSVLILVAGGLSMVWNLGIHRRLIVAAARATVQLLLLALVLDALFAAASPWLTAGAAAVMLGFAGREVLGRQDRRLADGWGYGVGGAAITVAATVVTLFALTTAVRPDPWYDPRYAIPLLGMILGNVMTGIAVGLNTLINACTRETAAIEARLALGATRWEALNAPIPPCLEHGSHRHRQQHGGGGDRVHSRHDDRPNPGRPVAGPGGAVSVADPVSHRRRNSVGDGCCGASGGRAHHRRPSSPASGPAETRYRIAGAPDHATSAVAMTLQR